MCLAYSDGITTAHVYIILTRAGVMEPSKLREFLNGPPLSVEVHDRDRIPEKHKLKAALFGDDLQDEKISNVGTVTSKYEVVWSRGVSWSASVS